MWLIVLCMEAFNFDLSCSFQLISVFTGKESSWWPICCSFGSFGSWAKLDICRPVSCSLLCSKYLSPLFTLPFVYKCFNCLFIITTYPSLYMIYTLFKCDWRRNRQWKKEWGRLFEAWDTTDLKLLCTGFFLACFTDHCDKYIVESSVYILHFHSVCSGTPI